MSLKIGTIGIIADDLTGANDTALQFLLRGCNTQILLNTEHLPEGCHNTIAWAVNTESRSLNPQEAAKAVEKATNALYKALKVDFIYKKIDSTMRGNIAAESLALLKCSDLDAAIIVPTLPDEGRVTVGGYHLLKGVPLERTEFARDPDSPISQSYIPSLLASQCEDKDIIAHIGLKKVMRGAGPILLELQEHIKQDKKLIVIDAVSMTDLEQIVLAMEKCLAHYKILPCGSAGLAKALTKSWLPDGKYQNILKTTPEGPTLVVIGSVTSITRAQVKLLQDYTEEFNMNFIELSPEQLIYGINSDFVNSMVNDLKAEKSIVIYSAPHDNSVQDTIKLAELNNIKQDRLSQFVLERLALITEKIVEQVQVKLVLVGGETASTCCKAIKSMHLQLIDEVDNAIPLCLDQKAQFIITKSGNLGTPKTLFNVVNYFKNFNESYTSIE